MIKSNLLTKVSSTTTIGWFVYLNIVVHAEETDSGLDRNRGS